MSIYADPRMRAVHAVTRRLIIHYVGYVCETLRCEMVASTVGSGVLLLLVDLADNVSLADFVCALKRWTTAWVAPGEAQGYWSAGVHFLPLSYQDKGYARNALDAFDGDIARFVAEHRMLYLADSYPVGEMPVAVCHHIILLTSRSRLLLPLKYRSILAGIIRDCARDVCGGVVACSSMRNHVHLLCRLPANISPGGFIETFKVLLLERMRANIHYRKAQEWDQRSLAFTVSAGRVSEEEHGVLSQEAIHWQRAAGNEMMHIYQKLDMPYVASLH